MIFSRPDWYHSTTGIPYRVGIYDENGRKRTLIELIVMLAIVTIENEHKWTPERIAEMDMQEFIKNPIHVKKDYKIQAMMDTIRIAGEESINKPVEIEERLQ